MMHKLELATALSRKYEAPVLLILVHISNILLLFPYRVVVITRIARINFDISQLATRCDIGVAEPSDKAVQAATR